MNLAALSWEDILEAYHALDKNVDKRYTVNRTTILAPNNVTGNWTLVEFAHHDMRIVKQIAFYEQDGVAFSFVEEPQYVGGGAGANSRFVLYGFTLKPITENLDVKWTSGAAADGSLVQVITTYYDIRATAWEAMTNDIFACVKGVL